MEGSRSAEGQYIHQPLWHRDRIAQGKPDSDDYLKHEKKERDYEVRVCYALRRIG
jgi:hypothetical protein